MSKCYIEVEAFVSSEREIYCKDCARRKGIKNGKERFIYEIGDAPCKACGIMDALDDVEAYSEAFPADVVTRDCYDKILAENDTMRDQLYCIGKYPGDRMNDVKPVVKGEWKWNDDNGYYYCSECGAVSPQEDQDGEYIDCPRFCPNCGAEMRKEAKE